LTVEQRSIAAPSYRVPAAAQRAPVDYHGTMGIDSDLMVCAQKAVRAMVAWIVEEHGLRPVDAYVLTSVVGDLHIHEIVDAGVWNVGMTVPLDIFV
jgi:acetamidase/formamidase